LADIDGIEPSGPIGPVDNRDLPIMVGRDVGAGGIGSMANASPTFLSVRQMPAMQNHGSPTFANNYLSFRFFFLSAG
jgi:hypothetical protein